MLQLAHGVHLLVSIAVLLLMQMILQSALTNASVMTFTQLTLTQ